MEDLIEYGLQQIAENPDVYRNLIDNQEIYREGLENYVSLQNLYNGEDLEYMVMILDSATEVSSVETDNHGFLGGKYGILDGLWDGITLPFNAAGDFIAGNEAGDATWARDGDGITSDPANDWYNLGYYLGLGTWLGGGNEARSHK